LQEKNIMPWRSVPVGQRIVFYDQQHQCMHCRRQPMVSPLLFSCSTYE
jgi:hypothetical protein